KTLETISKFDNLFITLGIGSQQHSLKNSLESFHDAKNCINSRIALGIGKVISYDQVKIQKETINKLMTEQTVVDFKAAIQSFNLEKMERLIYDILLKADHYKSEHTLIYEDIILAISKLFYDHICEFDLYKDSY